jgi:hypothetical protein
LEWLEIPCIGIYSGLSGSNLVFWGLDAREVFPLSTGFWLAKLGSKHKSCMKQTNIHVIENNHANFLESTNNFNLRILMLMSQSRRKAKMMYLLVFPLFYSSLKVMLLLTNAKFAKTN